MCIYHRHALQHGLSLRYRKMIWCPKELLFPQLDSIKIHDFRIPENLLQQFMSLHVLTAARPLDFYSFLSDTNMSLSLTSPVQMLWIKIKLDKGVYCVLIVEYICMTVAAYWFLVAVVFFVLEMAVEEEHRFIPNICGR